MHVVGEAVEVDGAATLEEHQRTPEERTVREKHGRRHVTVLVLGRHAADATDTIDERASSNHAERNNNNIWRVSLTCNVCGSGCIAPVTGAGDRCQRQVPATGANDR